MKETKYGKIRYLSLLMSILILLMSSFTSIAFIIPAFADDTKDMSPLVSVSPLDFGYEGRINKTVPFSELMEEWASTPLTEIEKEFIEKNPKAPLTYFASIPSSQITTNMKESGGATLTVMPYSYEGNNGITVSWTPVSALAVETDELVTEFNTYDGAYVFEFSDLGENGSNITFDVTYSASLSIGKDTYNEYVNCACNYASSLISMREKYESELDDYTKRLNAYYTYDKALKQYYLDLAEYESYLERKSDYDTSLSLHNAYLERLDTYNKEKQRYLNFLSDMEKYQQELLDYEQNRKDLEKYESELLLYNNYLNAVNERKERLLIMDSIYKYDTMGNHMYATLRGDSVSRAMLENKDLISQATGFPKESIIDAGFATDKLIFLTEGYKNCPTDKEKFEYYQLHYDEICEYFYMLYNCLYSYLDSGTFIRAIIDKEGIQKFYRYQQFVSQLYIIVSGLIDDPDNTRDPEWTVAGETRKIRKHYYELVGEELIPPDENRASPKGLTWPEEVSKPDDITIKDAPKKPDTVADPIKPSEVPHPGDEPDKKYMPTLPDTVLRPDTVPTEPQFSEFDLRLIDSYEKGIITKRNEASSDVLLSVETHVRKTVRAGGYTLSFHLFNGVVENVFFDYGETAHYPNGVPTDIVDPGKRTYFFETWVDENKQPITDLSVFESDMDIYAMYREELVSYTVTWNIRGDTTDVIYGYGETPTYDSSSLSYTDEVGTYEFTGFSPAIGTVTGDCEYTAVFKLTKNRYNIKWIVDERAYDTVFEYGDTPECPAVPAKPADDLAVYSFEGWNTPVTEVTENAEYIAVFTPSYFITDENGKPQPSTSDSGNISVTVDGGKFNISELLKYAETKKSSLSFENDALSVTLSPISVKAVSELGAGIRLNISDRKASLSVFDKDGNNISFDDEIPATFNIPLSDLSVKEGGYLSVFTVNGETGERTVVPSNFKDGVLSFNGDMSESYEYETRYRVTDFTGEHGSADFSSDSYAVGENVTVTLLPSKGYRPTSALYTDNGKKVSVTLGDTATFEFSMPDGGTAVEVIFEPIEYTVKFIANGEIISESTYHLGDNVNVPEVAAKFTDGDKAYVFSHWTPQVVAVTEDTAYTAVYNELPSSLIGDNFIDDTKYERQIPTLIVIAGVVFIGAVSGTTLLIVKIVKKRKRNGL